MTDSTTEQALILMVDDTPQNLQVLRSTLKQAGYRLAAANSGQLALRFLQKQTPDLILLDVIMPEMNGFEVCRQIKQQETFKDVPVIFLTARTDKEDVLEGFDAGGVDYITKPFHTAELLSRVKTHVDLKLARDTLLAYTERLQMLNMEKSEILSIVSHDLRNPLTAMLMYAQSIVDDDAAQEHLQAHGNAIVHSGQRMLNILSNLLDIQSLESGAQESERELLDAQELLLEAARLFSKKALSKGIEFKIDTSEDLLLVESDWDKLTQILDNLISNAIKYTPPQSTVQLRAYLEAQTVVLSVADQGPGFSSSDQSKMFQKFSRLSARPTGGEQSTGLGLSIVKRLCEMLDIQISFDTEEGQGSCFYLKLPRSSQELPTLQ